MGNQCHVSDHVTFLPLKTVIRRVLLENLFHYEGRVRRSVRELLQMLESEPSLSLASFKAFHKLKLRFLKEEVLQKIFDFSEVSSTISGAEAGPKATSSSANR